VRFSDTLRAIAVVSPPPPPSQPPGWDHELVIIQLTKFSGTCTRLNFAQFTSCTSSSLWILRCQYSVLHRAAGNGPPHSEKLTVMFHTDLKLFRQYVSIYRATDSVFSGICASRFCWFVEKIAVIISVHRGIFPSLSRGSYCAGARNITQELPSARLCSYIDIVPHRVYLDCTFRSF
jgi:hypothetical protein